jgi:hypothetical protein
MVLISILLHHYLLLTPQVCGSDWMCEKLVPRMRALYANATFYLHRITVLSSIKSLLMEGGLAGPTLANEVCFSMTN